MKSSKFGNSGDLGGSGLVGVNYERKDEHSVSQSFNESDSCRDSCLYSYSYSKRATASDLKSTLNAMGHDGTRKASNYNMVHAAALKRLYSKENKGRLGFPQGITGCPNFGNTCYFNTTIQSLFSTPPLTDYFLGYDYKNELNRDNVQGSHRAC